MIKACLKRKKFEIEDITVQNQHLLNEAVWVDLLSPTKEEEAIVEQHLGLEIPTREEMVEIELSSRLYSEDGTLFMTATMIAQSNSVDPHFDPVTFILSSKQLITIRYIEPHSFKIFTAQLQKINPNHCNAITMLVEILDVTVDRLADILEFVGRRLDDCSKSIFQSQTDSNARLDYKLLLQQIGINGNLNTRARESLVTFNRLITFFSQTSGSKIENGGELRLTTLSKDIIALSDHANFLSSKVNFLLDGTLGMVSIEQNNIIKIFSVAAVIFLPPTLVASIYGMNFHFMPELSWKYGYLISICLIGIAAWLPYKYFKYRKWL